MPIDMQQLYTQNPGVERVAQPDPVQASQASATGYQAQTSQIAEPDTASGRLNKITSQDSPLMQRAKQEGILTAGRRGLQNSSIAAGAAQGAMVDRALPLAQQEASQQQAQNLANQEAVNRASEVSTGRETDVSSLNAQLGTDVNKFSAAQSQEARFKNADATNRMREQTMLANADLNKQYVASRFAVDAQLIQSQYAALIGSNDAAAKMFSSYYDSVSQMMANQDIAPDRAAAMMTASRNMLQSGLNLIDTLSSYDLSGVTLPTFGTQAGPTGVSLTTQQQTAPTGTVTNTGIQPGTTITNTGSTPVATSPTSGYVAAQPTGTIGDIFAGMGWTRYQDPATGKYYNYDSAGNLVSGPY
jgi:hypothetical protein